MVLLLQQLLAQLAWSHLLQALLVGGHLLWTLTSGSLLLQILLSGSHLSQALQGGTHLLQALLPVGLVCGGFSPPLALGSKSGQHLWVTSTVGAIQMVWLCTSVDSCVWLGTSGLCFALALICIELMDL